MRIDLGSAEENSSMAFHSGEHVAATAADGPHACQQASMRGPCGRLGHRAVYNRLRGWDVGSRRPFVWPYLHDDDVDVGAEK